MMMVMISIKHSVGLWADMRLQSICLYLSIFNWTPDLSSYAIYNPPLHLIASFSLTSWFFASNLPLSLCTTDVGILFGCHMTIEGSDRCFSGCRLAQYGDLSQKPSNALIF